MLSAQRGAGHDLHSLREYFPQDDVRRIDWKATARSRRLMVREFTAEDEWRVHVVLDTWLERRETEGERDWQRFERGVTLAASLVAHFIDERAEIRLSLGKEHGGYGIESGHLYECLRRLALVEPDAANSSARDESYWDGLFDTTLNSDGNYVILLTTATPGSLPAHVWRRSHVIYL
jgi:uncharacterized protein (DUF58 family)